MKFRLDWSAGAQSGINYIQARNRVPQVGAFLAAFIDWLHANDLVEFNQVSMVGFSLGGKKHLRSTFHINDI